MFSYVHILQHHLLRFFSIYDNTAHPLDGVSANPSPPPKKKYIYISSQEGSEVYPDLAAKVRVVREECAKRFVSPTAR